MTRRTDLQRVERDIQGPIFGHGTTIEVVLIFNMKVLRLALVILIFDT